MTVAIIPARGGSTRIPKKNIKEFHGRPILEYAMELGRETCDRVIVSTEDPEIATVAFRFGAEVQQRPFDLAENGVGTQSVARYVLDTAKINRTERVVVIYPCSPLLQYEDVMGGIDCKHYAVSVGADPLRDAGAFYAGRCGDFRDGLPLYTSQTKLIVLPEDRVCDINTMEDWARAEQLFAALHKIERNVAQNDMELRAA